VLVIDVLKVNSSVVCSNQYIL